MTDDGPTSEDAAQRLGLFATRLLQGLDSTVDFFRACAGLWAELAGPNGLDGDHLDLFTALESWESSVGTDKVTANAHVGEIARRLLPLPPMTRDRLLAVLESEQIDPSCFSLNGGHPDERYVMDDRGYEWAVYYSERGLESGLANFTTESQACAHMLGLLLRDTTTRLRP